MILVDANLLIYASAKSSPHHEIARDWLDAQLNGNTRVALPWPSLLSFLRLMTNPRVFSRAATVPEAWAQVEQWLDHDNAWIPLPGEKHREILGGLLGALGRGANDVPDAHLAALAMEHGLTLCSADAGFARFPSLRWTNPITNGAGR